ncbi:hypothetical protein [Novosphingobium sp. MBES04]|uniref:hypothetical protein n=1 Tax=Novosphingobium sp. MBES04 TaxID=1206458 RepID=UPI000693827F|nr:hypothetical protein [Novosphingobium sp. MBES04]
MTEIQDHTERRLQIQVYQEWTRVAKAKPFPSMEDMEEVVLEGFHEDSVILQMTEDAMDPIIAFVGSNLRRDCGKGTRIERLPDVPGLTLLSRFTDTYLQCIANRAPSASRPRSSIAWRRTCTTAESCCRSRAMGRTWTPSGV